MKFKVKSDLKHNGHEYNKGDEIELGDEKIIEDLKNLNIIEKEVDLSQKTKDELKEIAKEEGIEISSGDLKGEILEKVENKIN